MSQSREEFYSGAPRLGSSRFNAGKTRRPKLNTERPVLADLVTAGSNDLDQGSSTSPTYWGVRPAITEDFSINLGRNFKENTEGKFAYIRPCALTIDRIGMGPESPLVFSP